MKSRDRELGMHRNITRRDLLHGMGALAATSFVPGQALADAVLAAEQAGVYPPALTGMRGSHVGSFEVAHQLAREGKRDWGPVADADDGLYDLIVVGAGISGLAAAHFNWSEEARRACELPSPPSRRTRTSRSRWSPRSTRCAATPSRRKAARRPWRVPTTTSRCTATTP